MPTMSPVLLRATAATKHTLSIVWDAPESGTAPTTYEVRVDGGTPVDVGLTNAYVIGGLEPDTDYSVSVRAVSGDGPSAWTIRSMSTVAFLREHFYRSVRNGEGALMIGATVAIYKAGTTEAPDIPIYVAATGDEERGPAWVLDEGVVDFYLQMPMIVDVVVTVPGRATPVTFPHQYVGDILDVDLVNDTVITAIDFDANTQFRQQQDARHGAAYANKATQTAVESGRLTVASLDTAYKTPLDAHLADTSDAHDASAVSFAPTGAIAANNVQDALVELDSKKATTGSVSTVATNLADHLADTSDAHDASAISFAPTGTVAATDVQAAIAELDSEVEAHRTDTTDVHGIPDTSVLETTAGATSKANAAAAAVAVIALADTDFEDVAHAVNTTDKAAGRPGFDTTGSRPVWATGPDATDDWVYADGTVAFTPA